MTLKIVVGLKLPEEHLDRLRQLGDVVTPKNDALLMSAEELAQAIVGADIAVVTITNQLPAALLESASPSLKMIANIGAGFNNIDVQTATRLGIQVSNTPDVLTDATADITLALILSATRRIAEGDRFIRSGAPWVWDFSFMWGNGLSGATLGIVGLGRIGLAVAERAAAFGMKIVASGGRGDAAIEARLGIERVELDELFSASDIVSLHCPLNEQTHHLVNAARLEQMKENAILINTARGPVVDEEALVHALANRVIAGAGLDVYENEPAVHPGLLALENVTLLPHLGSATKEVRTEMSHLAVSNVENFVKGESLLTPVN
ncbi:MAG: D-glycerate dehydrogenase [Microbacteriaceae bacterium]